MSVGTKRRASHGDAVPSVLDGNHRDDSVLASRTNPALYHRSTHAAADAHGSDAARGDPDVLAEMQRTSSTIQFAQQTMETTQVQPSIATRRPMT